MRFAAFAVAVLASACGEAAPVPSLGSSPSAGNPPVGSASHVSVLLNAAAPSPSAGALYGDVVAGLADLDGDGVRDFAVTATGTSVAFVGGSYQGQVTVRSAKSGALLFTLQNPDPQLQEPDKLFGHSLLGLGDLDGDGIGEIAVGARRYDGTAVDQGRVYLYRGADGSLLRALDGPADGMWFGDGLERVQDLDGDGVRDLLVTAPASGRAYVLAAHSGEVLRVFQSPKPALAGFFGWSRAAVDDLDGDGLGDVALGEIWAGQGEPASGHVYLFSSTGALLATLESPTPGDWSFGSGLAALGDVDGDGVGDLALVGAPGVVVVSGGRRGAPLYSLPAQGSYFGEVMSRLPDLDCDGVADVMVSARDCATTGAVYGYSGKSGAPLFSFAPPLLNTTSRFSRSLSLLDETSAGDVDVVVGASGQGPVHDAGGVFVLRLQREPDCLAANDAAPPGAVVTLP